MKNKIRGCALKLEADTVGFAASSEVPEPISSFIPRFSIPLLSLHDCVPGRTKVNHD
jgi:hypothetical protein